MGRKTWKRTVVFLQEIDSTQFVFGAFSNSRISPASHSMIALVMIMAWLERFAKYLVTRNIVPDPGGPSIRCCSYQRPRLPCRPSDATSAQPISVWMILKHANRQQMIIFHPLTIELFRTGGLWSNFHRSFSRMKLYVYNDHLFSCQSESESMNWCQNPIVDSHERRFPAIDWFRFLQKHVSVHG